MIKIAMKRKLLSYFLAGVLAASAIDAVLPVTIYAEESAGGGYMPNVH